MPTNPKTLSLYLTHLSTTSKCTLKRRIASIGIIHKMRGHYIDTKHPIIVENLMGIKRKNGVSQKGKKPLLINNLKLIINVLNDKQNNLRKKLRDKAILLIGFSGGFRRSELVQLEYEDIEFVAEGVKIFIKRSKTDQSGEGTIKGIPYFDNEIYCPVKALMEWLNYLNLKNGKIFNLSDKTIALIIKILKFSWFR